MAALCSGRKLLLDYYAVLPLVKHSSPLWRKRTTEVFGSGAGSVVLGGLSSVLGGPGALLLESPFPWDAAPGVEHNTDYYTEHSREEGRAQWAIPLLLWRFKCLLSFSGMQESRHVKAMHKQDLEGACRPPPTQLPQDNFT